MSTLRISVLDQSPIGEGHSGADALRASLDLARRADLLGFERFWVAEHHRSAGFAGSAPEVLAGAVLAATGRIRVGTGGVLLPRYPALKVAEVFGVLSSLYPGRVDMGIGRAGGPAGDFPARLRELSSVLRLPSGGEPYPGALSAVPPVPPELWLLGASEGSGAAAGELGVGFAFAHFLVPGPSTRALEAYRAAHAAATGGAGHGGLLAVRVVVADTRERADELAASLLLWRARKDLGDDSPLPSVETARRHRWTGLEAERAAHHRRSLIHGTAEEVVPRLRALAEANGVRELMVNTLTQDPADRVRTHELLAEGFGLSGTATGEGSVPAEPFAVAAG
ncbi:MsnO8 family LLM class oxidoreductase [Streptomyces sp. WAC08241]|uniref:MsnO8 family LLM class oxidoreductase n=1 Tax=Streptomyces sp. WAC08241 TaxID=2487421 RepID=UPI000F78D52B|nr:MsnO8 family LLM class oxidoreductase [Streptomyces sp. WAC08241]RSS32732.1 MsnO8 family LLM class oxidoreductase [Streptomyces sp. WAC08241]